MSYRGLFVCIFLLINSNLYAQFGSVNYIDTVISGLIHKIATGDFNNDGFTDVAVINSEWPQDKVKIYYNNSGTGFSGFNHIFSGDTFSVLHNFAVADIDNDGWDDIIISQESPNRIILLKNNSGSFVSQLFAQTLDFPTRIIVHDFDMNGFPDVLSLQHLFVVLYLQDSTGFQSPVIIHSGTEFYDINIDDFNGDGFTDVVVATVKVDFLHNDGSGNFQFHSSVGQGITFTLVTGDIDNDGDIDLITWEALQGILLYENNGTGIFSFSDTILQHFDNFRSIVVNDFDNDNDLDIYTTIGQTGQLIWMQNNGTGIFSPYSIIHTEPGQLVYEVNIADVNNDGAKEIIWGSKFLAYHLNLFPTGIIDYTAEKNIIIYPNPNTGRFYIKNKFDEKLVVEIFNLSGSLVDLQMERFPGETKNKFLDSGFYFIRYKTINSSFNHTEKLIIN